MKHFKSSESFNIIGKGKVFEIPYFENYKEIIGEEIMIDNNKYIVKEIERRPIGVIWAGTNEEYENRHVMVLV